MITPSARKGFTLIELLVVIAIIGILSAVVLASLNTARTKGADAAVKTNLGEVRAQAELFYDVNGQKYVVNAGTNTDVCSSSALVATVRGIYASVSYAAVAIGGSPTVAQLGSPSTNSIAACHADAAAWAAEAPLKTDNTTSYCVDSTGNAMVTSNVLAATATVCS